MPSWLQSDGTLASGCPDHSDYTSAFLWPEARKSFTISLNCFATVSTAYNVGAYILGIT